MNTVTETELAAKAVAPRVTFSDIVDNIASTWYMNVGEAITANDFQPPVPAAHPLRLLTLCVLVLRNGFTVVGKSACASPENFDQDMGQRIAREDAIRQCWALMGYALKERLQGAAPSGGLDLSSDAPLPACNPPGVGETCESCQ